MVGIEHVIGAIDIMDISQIISSVLLSASGSGIWALLGWLYFRRLKKDRRDVAYLSLFSGLDRLKDWLVATDKYLKMPGKKDIGELEGFETYIERYVSAIDYNWIVSSLPHKSKGKEIVWMFDLDFILSNVGEIVNTLHTIRTKIAAKYETYIRDRDELLKVMKHVLEAIESEIQLIPERIRSHGIGG